MEQFRADVHIHTVLSPCADLSMSPKNIVQQALKKNIQVIAVTDHNSTRNVEVTCQLGKQHGIYVIPGVEINTKEEVHCLAFFENIEKCNVFQEYIDAHMPTIKQKQGFSANQYVVDADENILDEVENILWAALDADINQIEKKVHELKGVFIPSHINRKSNGIISQLGFIPEGLKCDAFEITHLSDKNLIPNPEKTILLNSDAHTVDDIGKQNMVFEMEDTCFEEFKMAIKNKNNRRVKIQ